MMIKAVRAKAKERAKIKSIYLNFNILKKNKLNQVSISIHNNLHFLNWIWKNKILSPFKEAILTKISTKIIYRQQRVFPKLILLKLTFKKKNLRIF